MKIDNKTIYLKDFYDEKFYKYDINKHSILSIDKNIDESKVSGYYSIESCGLFTKKYVKIGYLHISNKDFLITENDLISYDDVIFKKKTILPFLITQYIITYKNKQIKCTQGVAKKEDFYSTNIFQVIFDNAK